MKNLSGLMKQASQMQAKMQEMQAKLDAMEVEGTAGAGLVTVVLTGKGDMKRLKIDPTLADPAEMEMLEDLVIAAHTEARRRIDELMSDEMAKVTGGMQLPGGMKLPF